MSKRLIWNGCKYILAAGLLAYIVWRNWSPKSGTGEPLPGLKDVWEAHIIQGKPIHSDFLALAASIGLAAVLLSFVRWYYLVRAQGLPFTLTSAVRIGLVGFYFSIFLPGSVGGDIIKAAFIARGQSRRTVAVATVILDRVIALWGLIWFVALLGTGFWLAGSFQGIAAGERLQAIVLAAGGIVGVSLLFCLLLVVLPARRARRFAIRLSRLPKIGHAAAEFWRAIWMYRRKPKSVLLAMVLALVGHVGFVLTFYFSARTLWEADQIPSLWEHFLIVPVGMVIQAMPLFPGGAGIGEAGYGWLYQLLDYPVRSGVLGSLVQRVIFWIWGLGGYLVYLRMKPDLQPVAEAADAKLATAQV